MKKTLLWLLAVLAVAGLAGTAWYTLTPWPKALLIRYAFERGGAQTAQALQKHVPAGIAERRDLAYRSGDRDARLDVFRPQIAADAPLPTIVWIHGGAWVSGSKQDVAPYLRILAAQGYTTVGVDYSIAPGERYPLPVVQANDALRYLQANAARLGVDPQRIVLAGDSAGAHIAAQLGLVITSPAYAREMRIVPTLQASQLRAMLLLCGAYDMSLPDYDGEQGDFLRTVLWSYSGVRDFQRAPFFRTASVAQHVVPAFPPSYLTAGNGDPLEPQSKAMAQRLRDAGVEVDTLFYPPGYAPALPHEYQFNLDQAEGRQSLTHMLAFLRRHTAQAPSGTALVNP